MKLDYRRLHKLMLKLLEGCNIGIPADLEYLFDLMRSSENSYRKYRTYSALSFITLPVSWGENVCGNTFVKKIYKKMRLDQGQHWIVGRHGIGQTKQFVKFMCHSLVHLPNHVFDENRKTHFDEKWVFLFSSKA